MEERFQVWQLGIDYAEYFGDFDPARRGFDRMLVGVGDSIHDAYKDVLEQFYDEASLRQAVYLDLPEEPPFNDEVLTDEEREADLQLYVGLLFKTVPAGFDPQTEVR